MNGKKQEVMDNNQSKKSEQHSSLRYLLEKLTFEVQFELRT